MHQKTAIIIGAGPAGLTAAYELLDKTDIKPIIYEMSDDIGGISKTINYKGNRIDIGGHRFFSKSDRVMLWWQNILPLQGAPAKDDIILERIIPLSKKDNAPDPEKADRVMRLIFSYIRAICFPIEDEKSLEDFFINRFGKELYLTFFKDYTEKVWGVPCNIIKTD